MLFDVTVSIDTAGTVAGVLTPVGDAGLVGGTFMVGQTLRLVASVGTGWIARGSRMTLAEGLVLGSDLALGITAARVRATG